MSEMSQAQQPVVGDPTADPTDDLVPSAADDTDAASESDSSSDDAADVDDSDLDAPDLNAIASRPSDDSDRAASDPAPNN